MTLESPKIIDPHKTQEMTNIEKFRPEPDEDDDIWMKKGIPVGDPDGWLNDDKISEP